jgi:hypothetical protein
MVSKVVAVSLPQEYITFLDENPLYSPSKLLQSKLNDLMISSKDFIEQLKHEKEKNIRIMITLNKQIDFINSKGLMEEFAKWNL